MDIPLNGLRDIETERLRLRLLELPDAGAFRAMTDEPYIIDMVRSLSHPFGLAEAEKLIVGDNDGRDCF